MTMDDFNAAYVAQGRRLYLQALRLTGSEDDAADAVQDVMARLWERRHTLHAVESPQAYAATLLRNRCLDIIAKRRASVPTEEAAGLAVHTDPAAIDRAEQVLRIIEALPDPARLVITMRDVEGHTTEEIVSATGLTEANIRVILCRTRAAIKARFKP